MTYCSSPAVAWLIRGATVITHDCYKEHHPRVNCDLIHYESGFEHDISGRVACVHWTIRQKTSRAQNILSKALSTTWFVWLLNNYTFWWKWKSFLKIYHAQNFLGVIKERYCDFVWLLCNMEWCNFELKLEYVSLYVCDSNFLGALSQ